MFTDATDEDIEGAHLLANRCFHHFRKLPGEKRGNFLRLIAYEVEQNREKLIRLAQEETSLGFPRLEMELSRTSHELRLFAELAENNQWREYSSEQGSSKLPPRPRLIKQNIPIGTVIVIGACNFPLAISVVGTDTASALAVGCPVIVKAHPEHPQTCQFLAELVLLASENAQMPKGVFQLIHGPSHSVTQKLISHKDTACVAFTGSLKGGTALSQVVNKRDNPIPFHAEMGSLNPVIALPDKIAHHAKKLALNYVRAVNLFSGQMCTKPGALIILKSNANNSFKEFIRDAVALQSITPMLNEGIYKNYEKSFKALKGELPLLATNEKVQNKIKNPAYCRIFELNFIQFINNPELRAEAFGPTSLLIECKNEKELIQAIESFEGNLTGSIHSLTNDQATCQKIIPLLESKVGRLLWNEFPPGVTPGIATHHGGPWPATTDSRHTSIGKNAYRRFVRPICKQGFPQRSI